MSPRLTSRRRFLQGGAALLGSPLILPRRLRGQASPPGRRLAFGCIGMGRMMSLHLDHLLNHGEIQVVAVCDVDTTRREHARKRVDAAYGSQAGGTWRGCSAHGHFTELLARPDLDAVIIATPDHWHAYITVAALRAGKHVYCEKPLAYNIHEALAVVRAVRETGRVLQTGSQQRSSKEFRVAAELVRNGVIGRVKDVKVSFGGPPVPYNKPAEPLEPGLDWDLWCGPGPLVNYNPYLSPRGVHGFFPDWRRTWEFGGGGTSDIGAHHVDIVQWALGEDGRGPVDVRAPGRPNATQGVQLVYADGTVLTHTTGRPISFFGSAGEVHVHRGRFELVLGGKIVRRFWEKAEDRQTSLQREVFLAERDHLAQAKVRLEVSHSHMQNFLEAIAAGRRPICGAEVGASSAIACHLMNLAYRHGTSFGWDPVKNSFSRGGDPRWLTRDHYRNNWSV